MFEVLEQKGWEIVAINHGDLIARIEFQEEIKKIVDALDVWNLEIENNIIKRGGGQADQTLALTESFYNHDWFKNEVTVENVVTFQKKFEQISSNSTTHEIDHLISNKFGRMIALEIEWNNKDEFFDRDFQSMRGLYELGVIDLAIIITRGQKLENCFKHIVTNYFKMNSIFDFKDFATLENKFRNNEGDSRFSFPTNPQAKEIRKKLARVVPFYQASADVFVSNKFGSTTTNWRQLEKRIARNNAGRTPMIFFGIPPMAISE